MTRIPNIAEVLAPVASPGELQEWLSRRESSVAGLRPDCSAELIWADPATQARSSYALVFLHGFSASPGECGDAPRRIVAALGCNAYLSRLPGHGVDQDDALQGIDAGSWLESAREALAVGQMLGDKVILLGSSLGASLSVVLAAAYPSAIAAVVAWSLGAAPYNAEQFECVCASHTLVRDMRKRSSEHQRYWASSIHPDGYRALRELFSTYMTPRFVAGVACPFFLAYYYRDAQVQDNVASVPAMLGLYQALGTPLSNKEAIAYPDGAHSVGSPWRSADADRVLSDTVLFLKRVLRAVHS